MDRIADRHPNPSGGVPNPSASAGVGDGGARRRAGTRAHSVRRARLLSEFGLRPGVSWDEIRSEYLLRSATTPGDRRVHSRRSEHRRLNRTYAALRLLAVD